MQNGKNLYYSFNEYVKKRFNTKVYKITIDAGFTCPTRDGTKGITGCIYCDKYGSGNKLSFENKSIKEQIELGRNLLSKKYNAKKFFIYFQAFTNTYATVEKLKTIYNEALKFDNGDFVGIIIGTRPDCIDKEKLNLISSYHPQYEVWIEYGLQSIHKKTLQFINRGHSLDDYLNAVKLTRKYPIKITTHIIVGLPFETKKEILETAKFLANLEYTDALKIHSFYIPKTSFVAKIYEKEKFKLLTLDEYAEIVSEILEILPPEMIIARLTGETDKENLLAPDWILNKNKVIEKIIYFLKIKNSFQGKYYKKVLT